MLDEGVVNHIVGRLHENRSLLFDEIEIILEENAVLPSGRNEYYNYISQQIEIGEIGESFYYLGEQYN